MRVFVWERIEHATNRYHSGGGVVVFAETIERARELALMQRCHIQEDEVPDRVEMILSISEISEQVFVMPDAGCC